MSDAAQLGVAVLGQRGVVAQTCLTPAEHLTVAPQVFGIVWKSVARMMNDWENHRTQSEYEDAYVGKQYVFQFINFYFVSGICSRTFPTSVSSVSRFS